MKIHNRVAVWTATHRRFGSPAGFSNTLDWVPPVHGVWKRIQRNRDLLVGCNSLPLPDQNMGGSL